jgi:ribonuclease HI
VIPSLVATNLLRESLTVKLSPTLETFGPSLMNHQRALQNPPIAMPRTGLPSHQSAAIGSDYLLVCEAHSATLEDGRWRFTLEAADGELILDASDNEFGDLNRLTLLAAVRGLEALEGPCNVTLLSNNRYLIRSLSNALPRWRQNNFRWEHFGRRIEVQHADLWRRIDRALSIHRVQACLVSSCVVSQGGPNTPETKAAAPAETAARIASANQLRIDAPHGAHGAPIAARRPRGLPHTRDTADTATRVPAPSDRLRRLLMGHSKASVTNISRDGETSATASIKE